MRIRKNSSPNELIISPSDSSRESEEVYTYDCLLCHASSPTATATNQTQARGLIGRELDSSSSPLDVSFSPGTNTVTISMTEHEKYKAAQDKINQEAIPSQARGSIGRELDSSLSPLNVSFSPETESSIRRYHLSTFLFLLGLLATISMAEHEKDKAAQDKINQIYGSKLLTGTRFSSSFGGRAMLSQNIALTPQMSLEAQELSVPLTTNYVLHELGIKVSAEQIAKTAPSVTTIRELIKDGATTALFQLRMRILKQGDCHLYFSCDKGGGRFIKKICRWDTAKQLVETFTLDTDDSGETSVECANAVKFSMGRMQLQNTNATELREMSLYGSTTDSGGGGTGHLFKDELLKKENLTCDSEEFLVGFCTEINVTATT